MQDVYALESKAFFAIVNNNFISRLKRYYKTEIIYIIYFICYIVASTLMFDIV